MKRAFLLLLTLALCLLMAACNGPDGTEKPTESENPTGPSNHTCSGEWVVQEEATCQKAGTRQFTCSCGKVTTETIPALAHSFAEGTCSACGAKDPDYVPPFSAGLSFESYGNGTCKVTDIGTCTDKDIVIPEKSDSGDRVTEIDTSAFSKADITSVVIPEGVKTIGLWSFKDCVNLESVTIPSTLNFVAYCAFQGCSNLSKVYISDLEAWCKAKFPVGDYGTGQPLAYGKSNLYLNGELLTDLVIPEGITTLNECVFTGCSSIESVTIPESVTSIGNSVFADCDNLVNITIPGSVTSMGDYVLSDCGSIVNVTIPSSVTSIGWCIFGSCQKLSSVTFSSETIPAFGSCPFWDCPELKAVYVSDALASEYAKLPDWEEFADKIKLESTGDPAGPSNFSEGLEFSSNGNGTCILVGIGSCTDTDIVIPETAPNGDSVVEISEYAFYRAFQEHIHITSIKIPDSVTRIGDYAFKACTNLAKITFGSNVAYVGKHIFDGCGSLQSLDYPASATSVDADMLYDCIGLTELTLRSAVRVSWPLDAIIREDDPFYSRITAVNVPAELVAEYQAASGWKFFGDKIQAIKEETDQ